MPEVSKAKLSKALKRVARARAEAEATPDDARLSAWEDDYLASLAERLETYGSAFRNPVLGKPGEPLSHRQRRKLGEIDAKLAGEETGNARRAPKGGGLARRTPLRARAKPRGGETS